MSGYGYKRTIRPRRRYVCSTPSSRHSNRQVRFRIVFFCFSEMSGPVAGLSVESESDPNWTSVTMIPKLLRHSGSTPVVPPNFGKSSLTTVQSARESKYQCSSGSRSILPCRAARAISMISGCNSFWQNIWLPQFLQKLLMPVFELWKTVMYSSPEVTLKRSGGTAAQVTKLAPWGRLHIEQWQCPQNNVGNSISNFTTPQKPLPDTDEGVMDLLQQSCFFGFS